MRQFLAFPLPPAMRDALAGLQASLRERCAGWSFTKPESIHLTLRFLGEVSTDASSAQRRSWTDAARGVGEVRLRLEGTGAFPGRARPRVLWVGVTDRSGDGRLSVLAARVEAAAQALGFAEERRPFRPHLTLARARQGSRPEPPPDGVTPDAVEAVFSELVLFRSELLPGGARHTRLAAFPLGGVSPDHA